jgi:hypothetical protein
MILRSGDTVRVSSLTVEYDGEVLKDMIQIDMLTGDAVFYSRDNNGHLKVIGDELVRCTRCLDMQKLRIYYKPWE